MIEAELAFFQVIKKLIGTKAVELLHTTFGKGPEALDAVYMIRAVGELIIAMINAKMLSKTNINQAVITTPFVGMDDDVQTDIPPYNGLQCPFLAIRHDLCINPSVTLENAKDDRFAARSAASFAANPFATKIGLINLDLAALDRSVASTFFDHANTNLLKDRVNTFPSNQGQLGCLARRQIHRKISQYLTKFLLDYSGERR